MAKRNYVEEILSVRLRNETSPRWGSAILRLLALEVSLQNLGKSSDEIIKYFPIGIVAVFEAYFRSAIAELIDYGPPFSENAARFEKERGLPLDFGVVLTIQGKKITMGELVGHLIPFRSLDDIDYSMSTVLQSSFLGDLKSTVDRWAVEVEGADSKPILEDAAETFQDVKEIFRLRHIYCHEIANSERPDRTLIAKCFESSSIFLKAADQLIWNLVAPGAPLSQSGINEKASQDLTESNHKLDSVTAEITSYLDGNEQKEFAAAQESWKTFRELEAEARASRWGRGGTIRPTLYFTRARTLTLTRIEELDRELASLRQSRTERN